jgi:endonuclease G
VGIKEQDLTGSHRIKDRGYLVLNPDKGKIGTGDSATIIQYPEGAYQQVALCDNKILDITRPNALIYQTDTAPGTSGSPVFNDQWQVIALHSAGVGKKNAADDYIDKNGNKIPVVNGTIDSTQIIWISNTGIRISSLMEAIRADTSINNNPLIQDLFAPSYTDNKRNIQSMALPETIIHQNTNTPAVSIATDTVQPNVTININIGGATPKSIVVSLQQQPHPPAAQVQIATPDIFDEAYESKINAEANADYAACLGFDENFMGFKTPIPALNRQLRRQVACLKENSNAYILKYDHYSTIFHSIRRVPVVSMINVEGNPNERQDKTTRQDNWLRDNRIDLDIQLNDNYYSKSGFDKGHLSRREDAKWGNTPEEAEVAAQMTCRYTNACPQVPELNRAIMGYHGLWGTLEQIVLEKGVTKETGKSSKICVYNGPIFVDTDPTYKGVQVAMRFFKIIVWRNGKNKKKATAFVLSQEDLVGGIQFEELQFDKEFIEHQCSIAYIEKLTGLTFKTIRNYDTSPKANDKNAVGKIDSAGVENLISSHA